MSAIGTLSPFDFIVAKVILEAGDNTLSQRELYFQGEGRVVDYIERHAIPPSVYGSISSQESLLRSIDRLREAEMLEPAGQYRPTHHLKQLFRQIGADWRAWPMSLPYGENGRLFVQRAVNNSKLDNYRK